MFLPTHFVRVAQATLQGSFNDARVLTAMQAERGYATTLSSPGSASVWNADFLIRWLELHHGWHSDVADLTELPDDDDTTMALQSTAAMAAEDPHTIALFPKPVVMAESVESVGEAGSTITISSNQSLLNLSMTTGMRSLGGAYAETRYPIESRCRWDCEFCGGVFAHMSGMYCSFFFLFVNSDVGQWPARRREFGSCQLDRSLRVSCGEKSAQPHCIVHVWCM